MNTLQKLDAIMQSGLQFKFFNKAVQDDYLWNVKCFWTHENIKTSEGFDSCEDCIDDCFNYLNNYKEYLKPENKNNK